MDGKRDGEILDHALGWAPYAEGDDRIWSDFGLTTTQFYRGLAQLLDSPSSPRIDPAMQKVHQTRCKRALEALMSFPFRDHSAGSLEPVVAMALWPSHFDSNALNCTNDEQDKLSRVRLSK